jgi:hypothetical protein
MLKAHVPQDPMIPGADKFTVQPTDLKIAMVVASCLALLAVGAFLFVRLVGQ